jgi:NADH:ubiquinone oxidoreductase subunit F (NADH-binding)
MTTSNHKLAIALRGMGDFRPDDLADYRSGEGFVAFQKALGMSPLQIIAEITQSGLRGRGGAGFPTGMKWDFAFNQAEKERYVIANADEGEPGTFKDRYIMERVPFRFLEGLMIAALAIEAEEAWIYIRKEYTESIRILKKAIKILYDEGLAGSKIAGGNRKLAIRLTTGAGSYLCGDETTLLESMEGKRGNPRYKPPFPAQKGFRGKPSVVNNVETLSHVPDIITHGAKWYRTVGTATSPGTKLYCLSGRVAKPGVYELPMGTTLRRLLFENGGGMAAGASFKGVLMGGAAGTFADASLLDVPMDYDELKSRGATLGSGAMIIMGEEDRVPALLHNILKFFRHESCGKCVPCRIGCHRLEEMSEALLKQDSVKVTLMEQMTKEATVMSKTSLCGLGQSPVLPVTSAFRYFSAEF